MAFEEINKSLDYNSSNLNAKNLKSAILRHLGVVEEALAEVAEVLSVDPLNFMAANEKYLLSHDESQLAALKTMMRDAPESYLELAVGYVNSGLFPEASDLLSRASKSTNAALANYPTIHYYTGYLSHLAGNESDAKRAEPDGFSFLYRQAHACRSPIVSLTTARISYRKCVATELQALSQNPGNRETGKSWSRIFHFPCVFITVMSTYTLSISRTTLPHLRSPSRCKCTTTSMPQVTRRLRLFICPTKPS